MIQQNKTQRAAAKKRSLKKGTGSPSTGLVRNEKTKVHQSQTHSNRSEALEVVYALLKSLPDSYMLFRECEVNGVPIDFLIASPNGISIVGVSSHKGAVSNNGQDLLYDGEKNDKHELSRVWEQALALRSMINEVTGVDYFVKTIICYPDAFVAVQVPIDETAVINGTFLCPMLCANRTFIPEKELKDIIGSISVR
ncbi:MAG: NERD domain-containing protein [Fibrobacterales bacterium]